MLAGRRLYLAISGIYLVTRLLLFAVGIRFAADYTFQHFHDPDLLRDRLGETLLYTHAFTPFINLLVGVVLKVSETHAVDIYQSIFFVLGMVLINAFAYLLRMFRINAWLILAVVTLFACTPGFIYFESFLHYEFIAAALIALMGVLLHRALVTGRVWWWVGFFSSCAAVAYVRTTFHLVWLVAAVLLALAFQARNWRRIAGAALVPTLLVVGLYAKNAWLFGFFGTSSMVGYNLAYMTTRQMYDYELREWVDAGKIHPIAQVNLYSPPSAYAQWVDLSRQTGIPVLDRQLRQNGEPNYNHWSFIETSKLRMLANRVYLREHRPRYFATVRQGWVDYFRPTTRWHPYDMLGRSPHQANRAVLEPWENFYNAAVHGPAPQPLGLYLFVIAGVLYAAAVALRNLWRRRLKASAPEKVTVFFAFCAVYVPLLSCLVTIGELERYRFMVEAPMWAMAAAGANHLIDHLAVWMHRGRQRPAPEWV